MGNNSPIRVRLSHQCAPAARRQAGRVRDAEVGGAGLNATAHAVVSVWEPQHGRPRRRRCHDTTCRLAAQGETTLSTQGCRKKVRCCGDPGGCGRPPPTQPQRKNSITSTLALDVVPDYP
eukprot:gene25707-biopygen21013